MDIRLVQFGPAEDETGPFVQLTASRGSLQAPELRAFPGFKVEPAVYLHRDDVVLHIRGILDAMSDNLTAKDALTQLMLDLSTRGG